MLTVCLWGKSQYTSLLQNCSTAVKVLKVWLQTAIAISSRFDILMQLCTAFYSGMHTDGEQSNRKLNTAGSSRCEKQQDLINPMLLPLNHFLF